MSLVTTSNGVSSDDFSWLQAASSAARSSGLVSAGSELAASVIDLMRLETLMMDDLVITWELVSVCVGEEYYYAEIEGIKSLLTRGSFWGLFLQVLFTASSSRHQCEIMQNWQLRVIENFFFASVSLIFGLGYEFSSLAYCREPIGSYRYPAPFSANDSSSNSRGIEDYARMRRECLWTRTSGHDLVSTSFIDQNISTTCA